MNQVDTQESICFWIKDVFNDAIKKWPFWVLALAAEWNGGVISTGLHWDGCFELSLSSRSQEGCHDLRRGFLLHKNNGLHGSAYDVLVTWKTMR